MDRSAKGAEYESQGQARSASPLVAKKPEALRPERPTYTRPYYALSGLGRLFILLPGATRSASRSRLPLAFIFRAFGAAIKVIT